MDKLLKQRPVLALTVITFIFVIVLVSIRKILPLDDNMSLLVSQAIILIPTIYLLKVRGSLHIFKFDIKSFNRGLLVGWFGIFLAVGFFIYRFDLFLSANLTLGSILIIIIANLLVGAFEEILLRGFVFNELLSNHKPLMAAIISGIIFGVAHVFNYLKNPPAEVTAQILYAFFLGVFFAAIYYVTKNIWSAILIHGLIDISAGLTAGDTSMAQAAAAPDLASSIGSAVFVVSTVLPALFIGIIIFKRHAKKQKARV